LCRRGENYRFPGHLGVDQGSTVHRSGDEQPIEAAAMADAASIWYRISGEPAPLLPIATAVPNRRSPHIDAQ
jgi:hypothetical protein